MCRIYVPPVQVIQRLLSFLEFFLTMNIYLWSFYFVGHSFLIVSQLLAAVSSAVQCYTCNLIIGACAIHIGTISNLQIFFGKLTNCQTTFCQPSFYPPFILPNFFCANLQFTKLFHPKLLIPKYFLPNFFYLSSYKLPAQNP